MSLVRFPLDDLVGSDLVREAEFREKLNRLDLAPYRDQAVLIPWLHEVELPIWVYLMTAAKLSAVVAVLSFREACTTAVLLQRAHVSQPLTSN